MAPYQEALRRRHQQDEQFRLARARRAWSAARRCAEVLRDEFAAARVAVYGSLARATFGLRSDIDIAVWSMDPSLYFEAVARLIDVGGEFEVNLAIYERCNTAMAIAIDRDSVDLP